MEHSRDMRVLDTERMIDVARTVLTELRSLPVDAGAVVLALYGDLGAGKTTFTKALARELGVADEVTSPTYLIMRAYETDDADFTSLIHIDAYRLEDPSELVRLEWSEEVARPHTLICIEWADKVEPLLPPHTVRLRFEHVAEHERLVTFT